MNIGIALLAAAVGYLLGSISWARIITGLVAPGTDISMIREPVPHTDEVFESDLVSATTVRIHVGTRYGCLTAILDMLKVALPTLSLQVVAARHVVLPPRGGHGSSGPRLAAVFQVQGRSRRVTHPRRLDRD